MTIKQREVYNSRYFRHGGTYAVSIPPDVRELMHLTVGDSILMNCEDGVLWMVRATKSMVIDRKKAGAIFEKLFAEKRGDDGKHV